MRGTIRHLLLLFLLACLVPGAALVPGTAGAAASPTVNAMRFVDGTDTTKVILDLSAPADYTLFQLAGPDRVVVDLDNGTFGKRLASKAGAGMVKDVRVGHYQGKARIVFDLDGPAHPRSFLQRAPGESGYRLVVELSRADGGKTRRIDAVAEDAGRPVVIAVDAGHGGNDPGARGKGGTLEKNVTLAIAEDLAKRINAQPGMQAVLTRSGDYFVPLVKRFQIAREKKADLFVSIHANSCPNYCDARGASVWVLSTHGKQSEAGRWLAKSENASDLIGGVSLDDKSHMLASVLLDLSQGASMHAAHEVGSEILSALGKIGPLYRSTVQGANFVVLRSPDVPSILVETAFISNRVDERRLGSQKDREQLANAVLAGVKQYFETTPPPGTWFAAQRNRRLHLTRTIAARTSGNTTTAGVLPAGATRMASVAKAAGPDADVRDMHKVARGETLSGIARQYGVSMNSLRSLNPNKIPSDGMVQAGQVLMIPSS